MKYLFLCASLLIGATPAYASVQGNFTVYGPGLSEYSHSCQAWLNDEPGDYHALMVINWLAGFASGWNAAHPNLGDALDDDRDTRNFERLVYKQCLASPNIGMGNAAGTILQRLTDRLRSNE